MIVTVFGANGKVGRVVVTKLLKKGYYVKAFVYGENCFADIQNLEIILGDVSDEKIVIDAIDGSDVVISTLGSWGTKSKNILTIGMSNIIPASQKAGIKQIISLTGAQAAVPNEKMKFLDRVLRFLLKTFAKKILEDGEKHISLLKNSSLNWTVVRSPTMYDGFRGKDYRLSAKSPKLWQIITRDSVASAVVDLLEQNPWVNQAPFIRNK